MKKAKNCCLPKTPMAVKSDTAEIFAKYMKDVEAKGGNIMPRVH